MANKKELLEGLTLAQIKELVQETDSAEVLKGNTGSKEEVVEALSASKTPSKKQIEEFIAKQEDEDADEEEDTDYEDPNPNGPMETDRPPADEETPPHTLATTTAPPGDSQVRSSVNTAALGENEEEAARERVEGRTSDAASRSADVQVDDVPPDLSAGVKSSDGGPERYPFPPQGDVDIATVPTKKAKGEFMPPIPVGSWVRLKADGDVVPDRFDGRVATVESTSTYLCNCDFAPRTHEHQSPEGSLGVKLRDETGALLTITTEHIAEYSIDGRHGVLAHG